MSFSEESSRTYFFAPTDPCEEEDNWDWANATYYTRLGPMTPDEWAAYADPLYISWLIRVVSDPMLEACAAVPMFFVRHLTDPFEEYLYDVKDLARRRYGRTGLPVRLLNVLLFANSFPQAIANLFLGIQDQIMPCEVPPVETIEFSPEMEESLISFLEELAELNGDENSDRPSH